MITPLSSMEVMERLMRICPKTQINAIPEHDSWEVVLPETVYLNGRQPHTQAKFHDETVDGAIQIAWQKVTKSEAAIFVKGKMSWPSIMIVQWSFTRDDWVNCSDVVIPIEKREQYRSKK